MFGIFLAFKSYDFSKGVFGSPWCGFDNFKFLFKTKDALIMTRNTILYNFAFIVIGTALGIFVAILLTEIVKSYPELFLPGSAAFLGGDLLHGFCVFKFR